MDATITTDSRESELRSGAADDLVMGASDCARPFLRRDTFYAEVDGGIQFASAGPAFQLTGRGSFNVFERIAPFLNGEVTRGELRAALGEAHWGVVEGLLSHLNDRGFLRWIAQDDVDAVDEADRVAYAEQIAFLAQYTDTPHATFAAFRDVSLHLVGEGPLADAIVENLAANGHRALHRLDTSLIGSLDNHVRAARHIVILPTVAALSWFTAHRSALIDERCLLVLPSGDRLWVTPHAWQSADHLGPDWKDAVIALEAAGAFSTMNAMWAGVEGGFEPLTGRAASIPVQRMLGALLSYEIFKGLTGVVAPETATGAISLDTITGETSAHRVLPSPARTRATVGPAAAPALAAPLSAPDAEAVTIDYDRWRPLVGALTMPLTRFADSELTQLPLKVAVVAAADGEQHRAASLWTLADARIEAITRGYERIAAGLEPAAESVSLARLDDAHALTQVDAGAIFRRSRANAAGRYENSAAAIGVALSAADATRRAVHKAVTEHLLLASVTHAEGNSFVPSLDDSTAVFLAEIAHDLGGITYVDLGGAVVAGVGEVHVAVAFRGDGDRLLWHVGAGATRDDAAAIAATEVLAMAQFADPLAKTASMRTWQGIDPRALIDRAATPSMRDLVVAAASITAPMLTTAELHAAAAVVAESE